MPRKNPPSLKLRKDLKTKKSPVRSSSAIAVRNTTLTRKNIAIVVALVVIVALLYFGRSLFVAATVNGEPISRLSVIKALEKQSGQTTLDTLITEKLIADEAKKRNITVSQSQVDTQMNTIKKNVESQGQSFDQALAAQGMTQSQLEEQLKIELLLEKMVGTTTVTDKQVTDYINQNKDAYPKGPDDADTKAQAKQQLIQQTQQQNIQNFVANLKKNAQITYIVNY